MFIKHLGQTGDTIVEVLIVLAILGSALGISYATASRSLQGARQAQEHTEALELVQSQIEQLRVVAATDPTIYDATKHASGFCVRAGVVKDLPNPVCTTGLYDLSITNLNDGQDTFSVLASWDDIRGNGKDTVSINYRVHP